MSGLTDDHKYLFVLSPPHSGSTLLWKILASSPNVSSFPGEGQHLDELLDEMRGSHWDSDYDMDWNKIRNVWESYWDFSKPVLLEKSPPNILRAELIEREFEPAYFVALMRDPYAFAEGVERRDHIEGGFERAAEFWVQCAEAQRRNIEQRERLAFATYERFTERPERVLGEFTDLVPELEEFDLDDIQTRSVMGEEREIRNLNPVKVDRLDHRAIETINGVLEDHRELVDYFDYEFLEPERGSVWNTLGTRVATFLVRNLKARTPLPRRFVDAIESTLLNEKSR